MLAVVWHRFVMNPPSPAVVDPQFLVTSHYLHVVVSSIICMYFFFFCFFLLDKRLKARVSTGFLDE